MKTHEKIAQMFFCGPYTISAVGSRFITQDEANSLFELLLSENDITVEVVNNFHRHRPETISLDMSRQKTGCDMFCDQCNCFMPDIDPDDIWCRKERKSYLESTDYRKTREYKKWRDSVFKRDKYTCQSCGKRGGELNAHHIETFNQNPQKRYSVKNGVTLCIKCHREIHKTKKDGVK